MNTAFLLLAVSFLLPLRAAPPPAGKGLGQRCSADFSIDAVIKGKTAFPVDSMLSDLRRYHMCEAFSRRAPELCKTLALYRPEKPQPNMEASCLDGYNRYTVTQLNITGRPDAAKICEALPLSAGDLDGEGPEVECAFQTSKPDPHCKNLMASKPKVSGELEDCFMQNILNGEGSVCPQIDDEVSHHVSREWCLDAAAYRSAFEAKDAGRCAGLLGCRMLMGEKVCAEHLAKVRREFCRLQMQESDGG